MYNELIIIIFGVFGACIGSFLNAVAFRAVNGLKWWGNERSRCDHCKKILSWYELIPIISFLIQFGRCRNCHKKISPMHLYAELICMAGSIIIYYKFKFSTALIFGLIIFFSSVLNSLTDIYSGDVFDLFAYVPGILGLLLRVSGGLNAFLDGLTGMAVGFVIFALIILLSRGGMGWGDANFMAGAGGILGVRFILTAFYFGIMTGGIWAIILIMLGRVKFGRGDSIALVPFLSIGIFLTLIYGAGFLKYLGLIFMNYKMFAVNWPF